MRFFNLIIVFLFGFIIIQNSFSQDWANLNRFKKENSETMSQEKVKDRIILMGNSITEGWANLRPEFFENKSYINRGISGQTTPQMLLRFRQDVINLKPDVVVILAGINDIAENTGPTSLDAIFGNIVSMSELAKANDIKVVLSSVLPANSFNWNQEINPSDKVMKLNEMILLYSKKNKFEYIDYFSAMVNESFGLKKELGLDSVHPNAKGYKVMEPLLEEAVNKVLGKIESKQ